MISPVAIKNGNNRGPTAALLGATLISAVSTATNKPSARTPALNTASPIRRLRPVVITRLLVFLGEAGAVVFAGHPCCPQPLVRDLVDAYFPEQRPVVLPQSGCGGADRAGRSEHSRHDVVHRDLAHVGTR